MRAFPLRAAIAAAGLAILGLLYLVAADAPQSGDAGQARIDEAIAAYASQIRAEQEAASDAAVARMAGALLRDPATPVLGNPEGDVAVIEFFDYTCAFCKAAEPRLRAFVEEDGGVKLVLKDFPILTPESVIASKAALASVRQGKFESFHHALIDLSGQLSEARIFATAESVGLDVERLREDMKAPEIADQIIANFNLARSLRVTSTPTFIIDEHLVTQPSAEIDFPRTIAAARAG